MSISPINNLAQTGLVPQTLLGYSSNGVSAIEINPTSITIAGDLNTATPIYVGISASGGLTTTLATGLDVNCDFNMNDNNITNLNEISGTTDLTLSASDIYTNTQGLQLDAGLYINLVCSNGNIDLTTTNGNINLTSTGINLTGSDFVNITASNDAMTLTAGDDITLQSQEKGIVITAGTGDAGNNDITLTTQNATLQGIISLQSGGDILLNAQNGAVVSITSADNTQISCGENFSVSTNNTTGLINLTTGDLFNNGGVKWNNYPMGITFFNKWQGSFSYNTPTSWEIINPTNPISFPPPFLYGTWAVQVSLNCWNAGSSPSDKQLAFYIDFLDGNSNTYTGFTYKQQTPFANWFNPSNYAQFPLSITYTDFFDFNGAVNNLELRLNWFGDNAQPQEFNLSTTFTLMTLI
jgi:hypothetical protein